MDAMRCTECGDVRWSFTGFAGRREAECELCGGSMVPERRLPHRGPQALRDERRDLTMAGHAMADDRPAAH
jgi:hypothetical protein